MKILSTLLFSNKNNSINLLKKVILVALITLNASILLGAVPPPGITKVPNLGSVCRGSALSVTLTGIPVSGCACNYQQQYMLPGETNWTSMAIGATIVPNTVGTAQIRSRIQCTGTGCDASEWASVSWTVVDLPSTPTSITRFPDSDLCIGATATAVASGSTGGTGSCYYLYSFWHAGRDQGAYSTVNSTTTDTISTLYAKARYYCDGYGCDTSNYSSTSWNISPDPLPPTLVKDPNLDSVCVGASVTVNYSTNTGGTGTCTDLFRSSNNGGTTWTSWSTTIPIVTVSNAGQIVIIQGRKECDGPGCNAADTSEVSWKGINDPVWGPISLSEDSLCIGGSITLNASTEGGSGGNIIWNRYYLSPFTTTQVTSPHILSYARTYYYYPQYVANPSNSGCNLDTGVNKKLIVVGDPTWSGLSVTPANDCVGAAISLSVNLNGGLGNQSISWLRDTINTFVTAVGVTSPNTPANADVYHYRAHYTPDVNPRGCNLNDGVTRTINIYPLPIAQAINSTPASGTTVCVGANISATFNGGTNSIGSEVNEYKFSINGGVTWNTYTPGTAINATTVGTNIIQIRTRKVASGTFCNSDWTTSMWSVSPSLVAPSLNVKTPNITSVCAGTSVNATITSGSGGIGCSDVVEFSINNGVSWAGYTSGQIINTSTATEVIIRAWRGNCDASSGCSNTSVVEIARWAVSSPVIAATITPTGGSVCAGTSVSATVATAGTGGVGCSDIFQSRYRSSGIWSAWISYTPGNNISSTGRDSLQIRSIRGCDPLSGCADTNSYTWVVNNYTVVSPTLTKSPNIASVCEGTNILATLLTAGSGGNGCSDSYQYRTNNGAWSAWASYVLGTGINTTGLIGAEIRTWRANCSPGGICGDSTINTYSWAVTPQPQAPTIVRSPLNSIICNSDVVTGTISWGTGGTGCSNFSQYRIKTGASWSVWYAYVSGQNIIANGRTEIEIKAWRGNCSANSGCIASDTAFENWIVSPNLTSPTLNRIPNRTSICQEEFASATLNSAGSGGINCSDIFEYRTNNGTWSAWMPYALGMSIPGTGLNTIEIQGYRGNCDPGSACNTPAPYLISWTVIATSTPPTITRTPDQDEVCAGTNVSATITPGTGGISCFDYRQYRYYNGTSWSSWISYTSGNSISTSGRTQIEVRSFRACQPTTGCISTDTSEVSWTIVTGITHPTMSKNPALDTVCQGISVLANIATPGSGGAGCSDKYEYRIKISGAWSGWNIYTPGTAINTDLSTEGVEIKAQRTDCSSGITCGTSTENIYSWVVRPLPIAPGITRVPNSDYLCSGQTASVTTTPGSGYSCSDYFQYRRFNGTTWSSWAFYPAGYNIPSTGYQTIEVRGFNRNCNSTSGCTPDTNTVSWTISPTISAPSLTKNPNVTSVCDGYNVSALVTGGSGGIGCTNSAEYTLDGGLSWFPYTSGTNINTAGVLTVTVRAFRANCNPIVPCPSSDTVSVSWTVSDQPVQPVIIRNPDFDIVCQGSTVRGIITPGTGGVGCSDSYKYRYHNGTVWSAWSTYPIGFNISTTNRTQIEIMAYRTCSGTGCLNTDTSTVHWDIDATIVNPTLTKLPNLTSVCDGADVSATVATPGSGGNGCSDVLESSIDGGLSWSPYTAGSLINTSSLTSVRIRAYRGDCITGGCIPTDTNSIVWNVTTKPTAPSVSKTPDLAAVCYGTLISATITPGTGGTSCTNYSQYRIYNGTTWTVWYNYSSGSNIVYPSNAQTIEVRAYRGGCSGGCASSDTTTISWNIIQTMINPMLQKIPNTATIIEDTDVSAIILVPGSNGSGCEDVLQFRVDIGGGYGAWNPYNAGELLSTSGLVSIQVRGFRGNCLGGDICPSADTTKYTWTVVEGPQIPTIIRTPNQDDVCENTALSALITVNGGGIGCSDYSQYRTNNGTVWSAWTAYVSGNNIPYPAGTTQVEVRAFRGNCDPLSGDLSSDTATTTWNIIPTMINPTLLKNPNVLAVCSGIDVSASILTAGLGGTSCSDLLEYRANNGSGFSSWQAYSAGNLIPTIGYTEIQIRGFRGGCLSGLICPPADTTIYSWTISAEPIAPLITRVPDLNDVCRGTSLSATITSGSGGSGCTEYYQSRQYNGSTWSSWSAYTSGNNIAYNATITRIELRAFRGNCDIASGCTSSDTTTAFWNILPSLVRPVISKTPNLNAICEGVSASAIIITPGSGGVGCTDIMEYRTNSGSGFGPWAPYTSGLSINTLGLTGLEIKANHENCTSGDECPALDTIVSWTITDGPIAPQLTKTPNQNSVCRNTNILATVIPGFGGDGCSDIVESRLFNGSTWSIWTAYTGGSNIFYNLNTEQVEVRAYRSYCDIASGCTSSDTNIVFWSITDNLTNPILTKNPNIDSVCSGINVSASILAPGSGGLGCTDILQYRVNSGSGFSAWFAYNENDQIPTVGYTEIELRGLIGNCVSGDECPPSDTTIYKWTINPSLTAPIISATPVQNIVCRGTALSATITPGLGGNGCTEYYQRRSFNGSIWTAWLTYTSGANIPYNPSDVSVEVRAFRGNCNVASGCTASDTNSFIWTIQEFLVNPILDKQPDVASICNVSEVSASIGVVGNGGVGCTDILEYRTNSGFGFTAWQPYAESDPIPTSGFTEIQVRGFIGNCISGNECPPVDTAIYAWTIQAEPVAPTIAKNPNLTDVCSSDLVSATITPGSGGTSCTETAQYRVFNGTLWSSWTNYTSGNNIPIISTTQTIEVRAFRGNCNPLSGCASSDTTYASWNVIQSLVNPILAKTPATTNICQGIDVSATIQTPGSGGVGCSDILEFRTNSGSGFSTWLSYSPGDALPTFGLTGVEIRGFIGNCFNGSQCPPADTTIYSWVISINPTAPIITRTPNLDTVCRGTAISATIIAGTGGSTCTDTYQRRTYNGTTWSAWSAYVSGTNIGYAANITQVEVRGFRGGCSALSGCLNSDTSVVHWVISEQPINPVLAKLPNIASVCDGQLVSATLTTPGSGGSGCSDGFSYRTFDGTLWSGWLPYTPTLQITTTGITKVQIIAFRENCNVGSLCTPPVADTISWLVVPQPTDPTITKNPNENSVCFGTPISGTITPGVGGSSCTNFAQYRMFDGTTWSAWSNYTSANNIVYGAAITTIEVRAFRGDCAAGAGCVSSDTASVTWNIEPQPIAPVLAKVPNTLGVCQGTDVQATLTTSGAGGMGCADVFEFRTNDGTVWTAWQPYTPATLISTTGVTQVQIQSYRGNCLSATCTQTVPVVLNWIVSTIPTAPTLTPVPNTSSVCQGAPVSAAAVAGSGGIGCNDEYQYRTYNGTIWTAWLTYTPANTISTAGLQNAEIRGFRTCPPAGGCLTVDTSQVQWIILENVISPVMTKTPSVDTVCEGTIVSATLVSAGTGGTGCSDIFEFSTNNGGSWAPYTPGSPISSVGLTNVQVRYSRSGCPEALLCGTAPTTFTWVIVPPIVAPTLTKTPDLTSLCQGTNLKALVVSGSGGASCGDVIQYRTNNGTLWTAWAPYISNTDISSVGISILEIRAFRGNCSANSLCIASDTNSATWNIFPQPVAPIVAKNPNVAIVCEGTDVSAVVTTAGSDGSGCSDVFQYRTDNGGGFTGWMAYTPPTAIPTLGMTAIQIISYRGNCDAGSMCTETAVDTLKWNTAPPVTNPLIVRTPDADTLCTNSIISAIVTPATGGTGCTNYSQYRMKVGSIWTGWINYVSGNTINHGVNVGEVQLRAFRGNCTANSGCATSDTTFTSWTFIPSPIGPVLQKNPNVATVCDGSLVNATILTPGSGGYGCSDVINYRTNNGGGYSAWMPYTPGTPISTVGLTKIQLVSYRGNCNPLGGCDESVADSILWTVVPGTTNPSIVRNPDQDTICRGTLLRATITNGIGGEGCSNFTQFRTYNGTTWSAWANYTSNAIIPYANSIIRVETRAYRGDCTMGTGCLSSDTISVFWNINPQPIAPILTKIPDVAGVCAGTSVSAALTTPGSGGVGCSDNSEYRLHNGTSWSAWIAYTAGTSIITTGLTQVEIRSWRGACPVAGCISTDTTVINWIINTTTTEPLIIRTPDQDLVCQGTLVSATITSGTGGSGCNDVSEYRTLATSVWSAWTPYISTNTINSTGIDSVEVRTYRICPPITGCPSTDTNLVAWKIAGTIVMPVLSKVPNTDSICEMTMIGANIVTPGSGGTGCVDIYEISTNGGTSWSAYTPGNMINSAGLTDMRIRFIRTGCPEAALCGATPTEFKWIIVPQPISPTIVKNPMIAGVCEGTPTSATITSGFGGVGCTDLYESRTNDGTSWSAWIPYISNAVINNAGIDSIEIRVYRGNCNSLSGCFATDTTTVSWIIYPQPIAPVLAGTPVVATICEGTDVSAAIVTPGSGGAGCGDVIEYRTDSGSGYGPWAPYTPPTIISTIGLTNIQIISYRGNCDLASLCIQTPVDTITWNVTPPVTNPLIVRTPDTDTLCSLTPVFAVVTPATGGVGCANYSQFRMKVGTIWTGWINYTSGNTIPHGVNVSEIEIRAFRGNCLANSGCGTSDTTFANWIFVPDPIAPVLQKNPDVPSVCTGVNVNASLITAGTNGSGCSDLINYRTDNGSGYGAWTTYIPGTDISTTGLISVQIVSQRGDCNPSATCVETAADTILWMVTIGATAPTIAKTPDLDTICNSTPLSASITNGTGGSGCSDFSQYRYFNGTVWSAWTNYVTSTNIPYIATSTEVQVRAYRGDCDPMAGCVTSDTAFASWIVAPQPTNPVLTKLPNIASICDGTLVSATVTSPGIGGSGCADIFEYRTNNGVWSAWQAYIPGTTINTAGITTIQITAQRGNCNPSSLCVAPDADTLTWTVLAPPIPPTVVRVPDNNVCNGDAISATITPGSGGLGCSETYQYRLFDGTTWSSWLPYTSGDNIVYAITNTQAEVRVFRANCDPASGCNIADTNVVNWIISMPIVAPVMAKEPNIAGVCDGTPVSATLVTAGSGGLNCTDSFEYRINSGSGFGAWIAYVPATSIPTTGLTEVEIRSARDICDPLNSCPPPAPVVLSWFVAPQPIGPSVVRIPNVDSLCAGPGISGTITPGSGGAGCVDVYEYRVQDTLGTWTAWLPYPSDSILQTNDIGIAQIRVSRTNCFPESGCAEPLPVQVEWRIFPQPIPPILTRTPDQNAVCESTLLSANFTGNAGGVPPTTIIYQYENPSEWTWNPGNSFTPNANGMAYIRAKATSNGYGCLDSEWEWVSWIVDPKPVITAPADQTICENGSTEITAVVVGGYGVVNYSWEMSTTSCAGPWSVVTDSTRSTLVTGPLSTTTWYRLVASQQATSCFDVSSCIAINIKPAPTVTISGVNTVCSGGTTLTATVTNQPDPVVFQWQSSNLASGPWANTGTNSNVFNIPSVEGSHYYRCIVMGDTIGCTATSTATLVQLGTIPTITYQSSDTSICNGQNIFLHVVAEAVPTPTYQWFGPSGLIVGETSDTLFLNNTQLIDNGTYYCDVMSACDTVTSQNIQVNVLQNLVAATAITGTTNRCQGAGFNLYTNDAQEVLTNNWSITPPEAGTIDATGLVSWNSDFAGTAQISASTVGCDITSLISINVIVDTAVTLPTISGTIARCQGVGTDQYVAVSPGATSFVWNISNAGISTINPTTGLVDWDSTFVGISTIFVYANGCGGPSANAEYIVNTIDSVKFTQSGNQNWCINDSNALWVSPVPNIGNSFQWYNSTGEIAGATNSALVFNPTQEFDQGAYYCRIITLCGDTLISNPDTVSVHPLPHVDFLIAGVCRLDSVNFINLSTITNGTISYQWTFGDGTTSTSMNPSHIYLVADTFNVVLTATSSWGCSKMFSQTLIIHELPQATVTTISDSCNNSGRGSIIITPTFGTPPYSYLINGGLSQLDSIFTALAAGNYLVTIVDSNNCRTVIPAMVTEPNILKTHIYPNDVLCYNDSSGIANLQVTGGTEPYQFVWSDGQTGENLINVPIGTYDVVVVDANGCFAMDTVTLIQPNPLIVDSMVVQTSCLQLNDGKIFVFVSGGNGIYDYLWSTGEMVDSLVNLSPNIYQITITDGNGCKSIHNYEITINDNECLTIWTSFSPDGDGTNDVWNIGRIGLYPNNVVQIFNRWGAQLFESKGYSQPWDGTWNNKPLPAETYYYVINLGDGSSVITGTVTIIR